MLPVGHFHAFAAGAQLVDELDHDDTGLHADAKESEETHCG